MPLFILLLALLALPLHAASTSIAALVNDEPITNADVEARVALNFLNSGMQRDADSMKRARERALKSLIDEQLQLQEIKKEGISVEKEDIDRAIETIAKQNDMDTSRLERLMQEQNVPKDTLVSQIKAGIGWSRLVQRNLRAQVEIGDDEINAALERVKANEGKPEALMSEIFLAVENPADDQKVKELADSLVARIKQGASFAAIAQQFSQGTGAIGGGDIGWVQPGQMTGELDQAVRKLAVGQISLPIHTADGYYILAKRDERTISAVDKKATQVRLKQVSLALNDRPFESLKPEIEKFRSGVTSCDALEKISESFPEWKSQDLGTKRLGELPAWLAKLADTLPLSAPSAAMEKSGYALILYVCERNNSGVDRGTIMNSIGGEKLDLQARRLLRDLRRNAAIEVKGQ